MEFWMPALDEVLVVILRADSFASWNKQELYVIDLANINSCSFIATQDLEKFFRTENSSLGSLIIQICVD